MRTINWMGLLMLGLPACADIDTENDYEPLAKTTQAVVCGASAELPLIDNTYYKVTKSVTLNGNCRYQKQFRIEANNVTLNCAGATIAPTSDYAIEFKNRSGVRVLGCNLTGSGGISVRDAYNPVGAPVNEIAGLNIHDTTGMAMLLRTRGALIHDNVLSNNDAAIYLAYDSNNNHIYDNHISGTPGTAINVDSSYENLIERNYIYNNVDGIEVYRNCGEHGETPRPSEAHSNEIRYNTIYNHHNLGFGTSSFKARHADKSHGIHVGSRQALPFPNMQNWTCQGGVTDVFCTAAQLGTWKGAPLPVGHTDASLGWPNSSGGAVGRCNNSTYERIDWQEYKRSGAKNLVATVGGRMSIHPADYVLFNRTTASGERRKVDVGSSYFTADRNWDFAPSNNIHHNTIFNNDVGIEVEDQETRVADNSFTGANGSARNYYTDVIIGNWLVDQVNTRREAAGLPTFARYMSSFHGNTFSTSTNATGVDCLVSSTSALNRVFGSDRTHCSTNLFDDTDFARGYAARRIGKPGELIAGGVGGRLFADGTYGAVPGVGGSGHLVYGPYVTDLPVGERRATFVMSIGNDAPSGTPLAVIDAYIHPGNTLASLALTKADFTSVGVLEKFTLPFNLSTAGQAVEFRVYWFASATIKVDDIQVQ